MPAAQGVPPLTRTAWIVCIASCLAACSSTEKRQPIQPAQPVVREVPSALRGTIGADATFQGIDPVLVSGLGIVVGLNGTGGGDLPDRVGATMERELAILGVSPNSEDFRGTPYDGMSPRQMLRDKSVAVVVVQAAIPPGTPEGAKFDVVVRTLDTSPLTSLEGGLLWTTTLRIGPAAVYGGITTRKIAEARGPVFINPFSDPAQGELTRRVGRILDGGTVTDPLEIRVVLDNPLHSRARSMVSAVNSRFPPGPGDQASPARGVAVGSSPGLALKVPAEYTRNPADFLRLVQHLPVGFQEAPQEHARRYVEAVKSQPFLAEDISWCMEAVGPPAIPFIRELYDYAELAPRLAALRAGARLGDPKAIGSLKEIARTPGIGERTQAIRLLGDLAMARIEAGPSVDQILGSLLDDPEAVARIAAYEQLARRAEAAQLARITNEYREAPPGHVVPDAAQMRMMAQVRFPAGMQGVERVPIVAGGTSTVRFLLDIVPAGEPMIYVTQQGQPRIVLFGEHLTFAKPLLVSAWSDRFMLSSEAESDSVKTYYYNPRLNLAMTSDFNGGFYEFVAFLAHRPTPEDPRPGLDMDYSDAVGALLAMQEQGAVDAAFMTETDRLNAEILRAYERETVRERPETGRPGEEPPPEMTPPPPKETPAPQAQRAGPDTWVVPLRPRKSEATGG